MSWEALRYGNGGVSVGLEVVWRAGGGVVEVCKFVGPLVCCLSEKMSAARYQVAANGCGSDVVRRKAPTAKLSVVRSGEVDDRSNLLQRLDDGRYWLVQFKVPCS